MLTALLLVICGAAASAPCEQGAEPVLLQPAETIVAIQVHGNTLTPDEEIRRLAGTEIGGAAGPTIVEDVTTRLRATGRFENVEVLKRFASISDPLQIMLVIIVDEGPVHIRMTGDPDRPAEVVPDLLPTLLVLPVLTAEDGYGVTYGVRLALPDPAGERSRLSFPFTWGGEKRAAIELDTRFEGLPVDRVLAGGAVSRRTNPFFDEDDDRVRVWVRAEREVVRGLRGGASAGWQQVSFMTRSDRVVDAGADLIVDTRTDPVLARNAVYGRASVVHLRFADPAMATGIRSANRLELEARGYLGLIGQNILAVRILKEDSDRPLPPYLGPLLGGTSTLRGFRAGMATGDTLVAMSAELLAPVTSPLSVGKLGVSVFADRGAVYDKGKRLADQTLKTGYGASVWFAAAFLRLNLAVAHGMGASTRVHVGATASF
jgi:hypothetical protein